MKNQLYLYSGSGSTMAAAFSTAMAGAPQN